MPKSSEPIHKKVKAQLIPASATEEQQTKPQAHPRATKDGSMSSSTGTTIPNSLTESEITHEHEKEQIDDDMIIPGIKFINYRDESQLDSVMKLVGRDLSEPYSVFTYRYFLHRFPELCIFAVPENDTSPDPEPIGCIVCKIDPEDEDEHELSQMTSPSSYQTNNPYAHAYKEPKLCGYIGMLAVDTSRRRSGIGSALVKRAVRRMQVLGCSSIILETEVSNKAAMKLYEERLGFMREEFLVRYYLNNGDAYRLRLWLK